MDVLVWLSLVGMFLAGCILSVNIVESVRYARAKRERGVRS